MLLSWFSRLFDFGYDSAAYSAQQGKWSEARDKFKKLVVDRSQDPALLYDVGVSSFETKEFEQAAAYFKNVVTSPTVSNKLKEQALFNLGNAYVELKKLQDAIDQYREVLRLNPENKRAKHNLEIVKKNVGATKAAAEKTR